MGEQWVSHHICRRAQLGAAGLAIVFLILFLVGAALATSFSLSGSLVRDAAMIEQQVQALFLAESGMYRVLRRFGSGTPCTGSPSLAPDGPHTLGSGSFTVVSSAATANAMECRVQVQGAVSGVSRVVEAIVQKSGNGFPPDANVNFNLPPGACVYPSCMPTNWIFSTSGWDDAGGPDSSRAAYISKTGSGSGIDVSAGGFTFSPPITRVGPRALKIDVDYSNIVQGGANKIHVDFVLYQQSPGTATWSTTSTTRINSGNTAGLWRTTGTSGAAASATVMLPGGTFLIDRIDFTLTADSGNNYSARIDNITIDGADASAITEEIALIKSWREVVQ